MLNIVRIRGSHAQNVRFDTNLETSIVMRKLNTLYLAILGIIPLLPSISIATDKTLTACSGDITITSSDTNNQNCTYSSGSNNNTINIQDNGTWEGSTGTISGLKTTTVNIENGSTWNLKSYGYTSFSGATYAQYRPIVRWYSTLNINLSDNSLVDTLIASDSGGSGEDYIHGNINSTININASKQSEFRGSLRNGNNGGVNNINLNLNNQSIYTGGITMMSGNHSNSTTTINLDNSTFQKGTYDYEGLTDKRRTYLEISGGNLVINANNQSNINHDIYGYGGNIDITLNDSQITGSLINIKSSKTNLILNGNSQAEIFNYDYQGAQSITINDNATLTAYSLQEKGNTATANPAGQVTSVSYLNSTNTGYLKKYVQAFMITDSSNTAAQEALLALQKQDSVTRTQVDSFISSYGSVLTLGSLSNNLTLSNNATVDVRHANLVVSNLVASDSSTITVDSDTYNQLVITESGSGNVKLVDTGDQSYLGFAEPLIAYLGSNTNNLTITGETEKELTAYTVVYEDNSSNNKQNGWYYHANGLSNTAYGIQAIAVANLNTAQIHGQVIFNRPENYRLNPEDKGAIWIQPFYEKQNIITADDSNIDLSGRGIAIGADKKINIGQRDYLIGIAASFSKFNLYNQENYGNVKTQALHAYASYQAPNNLFIDLHTQINHNHNKLNISPIGKSINYLGKFNNIGVGINSKIGYQYQANLFFATPYIELSLYRQNEKDYKLYRYTIHNKANKSIQTNIGSRLGYTFDEANGKSSISSYIDVKLGREFIGSNKVYLGDNYVNVATKGHTIYTAVGTQLNLNGKTAGYLDIGYKRGKLNDQTTIKAGLNYLW